MIILQRNFSKEEARKLKFRDRILTKGYMKGELRDIITMDDPNSSDEEYRKARNRELKRTTISSMAGGAAGGALAGAAFRDKRLAAIGATGGAIIGASGALGSAIGLKTRRNMIKKGNRVGYNKMVERQTDARRVRVGDMTAKEFKKKWYKD